MNEEEITAILKSLKWPNNSFGYLLTSEEEYPTYRDLSKMFKSKRILQDMTWCKAQCIEALGGIEEVNKFLGQQEPLPNQILLDAEKELAMQEEIASQIKSISVGLSHAIKNVLSESEETHLSQQKKQLFE